MYGVDKGDQIKKKGCSFAKKAHFQKWYIKYFFAIMDCMLLNSLITWNLYAEVVRERNMMNNCDFFNG